MFMIIKITITIVINIIVTIDVFIDKPRFDFKLCYFLASNRSL